ncbi:MAG TPA: hypothetical protein VFD90_21770 [Gaiellales bacterium]|jgi:hypothetical protein|nr:hypothetical protein [Gaiellales bacterium]
MAKRATDVEAVDAHSDRREALTRTSLSMALEALDPRSASTGSER